MANTYLTRTPSGAGNRKTWTWSGWIKRSNLGAQQLIMHCYDGAASNRGAFKFQSNDTIGFDTGGSGSVGKIDTSAVYRDVSAWYHIVVVMDTTNATATDRQRIYVNGVRTTTTVDAQVGVDFNGGLINSANAHEIGTEGGGGSFFNGSMSHIHFIDGTAYDASAFGETDATTGEWKIKTSPSVTYGTNGFFILKDGNSVTDQSGEGNDFTVGGGTLTKTEDNPSNVFATLNGVKSGLDQTLSNGNTTMVSGSATTRTPSQTTLGMSSGKYYAEFKITNSDNTVPGIVSTQDNSSVSRGTKYYPGSSSEGWGYTKAPDVRNNSSAVGGTWSTFAVGDIIGVAINLDNLQGSLNKLYFSKNGVWQNGADPSNFTSVTGVVGITAPSSTTDGFYYFSIGDGSGGTSSGSQCNFGNGYFGTTAVSSAGTNASGIGIFEYDVPTGFTALSTKGLNL